MPASDHLNQEQHETFYHLTSKRKFKLNPKQVPADNALSISPRSRPGLYVAPRDVEYWWNAHQYHRPYVAEITAPKGVAEEARWGGERFIPGEKMHQAKVNRVIPVDAHVREKYGLHGWVEEHHGTTFDTGEKIPEGWQGYTQRGYQYQGPDVREFTPEQHAEHTKRLRSYRKSR
jgi:hypothetical protein